MNQDTLKKIDRLFENDDVTDEEAKLWLDVRSKIKHPEKYKVVIDRMEG